MKADLKTGAVLAALAVLLWGLGLGIPPFPPDILVPVIAAAAAVSMGACGVLWTALARRRSAQTSPYKSFALAVVFCAAAAAAFAFYDIRNSSGMMAGILGTLILLFFEPAALLLLIVDFICWRISK